MGKEQGKDGIEARMVMGLERWGALERRSGPCLEREPDIRASDIAEQDGKGKIHRHGSFTLTARPRVARKRRFAGNSRWPQDRSFRKEMAGPKRGTEPEK
jgi:hypothetical protein